LKGYHKVTFLSIKKGKKMILSEIYLFIQSMKTVIYAVLLLLSALGMLVLLELDNDDNLDD